MAASKSEPKRTIQGRRPGVRLITLIGLLCPVAILLLGSLSASVQAAALQSWQTSEPLSDPATSLWASGVNLPNQNQPLLVSEDGVTFAAFSQGDPSAPAGFLVRKVVGQPVEVTQTDPAKVGVIDGFADDGHGNVTMVSRAGNLVQVSERPAGGDFGAATTVYDAGGARHPFGCDRTLIAKDGAGDTAVLISTCESLDLGVAYRPAGGHFGAPIPISPSFVGAQRLYDALQFAMTDHGEAIVAGGMGTLYAATVRVSDGTVAVQALSRSNYDAHYARLAVAPGSGDAALTWSERPVQAPGSDDLTMFLARRVAGQAFGAAVPIGTHAIGAVAMRADGTVLVDYGDALSHTDNATLDQIAGDGSLLRRDQLPYPMGAGPNGGILVQPSGAALMWGERNSVDWTPTDGFDQPQALGQVCGSSGSPLDEELNVVANHSGQAALLIAKPSPGSNTDNQLHLSIYVPVGSPAAACQFSWVQSSLPGPVVTPVTPTADPRPQLTVGRYNARLSQRGVHLALTASCAQRCVLRGTAQLKWKLTTVARKLRTTLKANRKAKIVIDLPLNHSTLKALRRIPHSRRSGLLSIVLTATTHAGVTQLLKVHVALGT